ncbi:putative L antigen [Ixodes scapularis]
MDLSKQSGVVTESTLSACVRVPFPSEREAEIAYNSLRVDPEPKRSMCSKKMTLDACVLQVAPPLPRRDFCAKEARQLRVALNSFFDLLLLATSTMDRFGPAA